MGKNQASYTKKLYLSSWLTVVYSLFKTKNQMNRIANFGNKINTNGLDKNPQNRFTGSLPSFKKRYKEILNDDSMVWLPAHKTVKRTKDGTELIGFQLPRQDAILAKLTSLVTKAKDSVSLAAIKQIVEMVDGKNQKIELSVKNFEPRPIFLVPMSALLEVEYENPQLISDEDEPEYENEIF